MRQRATMRATVMAVVAMAMVVASATAAHGQSSPITGSVIFIHPDGASSGSWTAARARWVGPDGDLHWDRLPAMALYRGHLSDSLTATSNAGGTIHAYGVKTPSDAYGLRGGEPIVDAEGRSLSVAHQAMRHGLPVGLVNSGTSTEPGTGCFLASVPTRSMHDEIAAQLIHSGAAVLLGGGEQYMLPEGVAGRHGPGKRQDGRNLIEEARELGYTVVFTREELANLPENTTKLLGVFAANNTFHAQPEEALAAQGLPLYEPEAPTIAEMTAAALAVLERHGKPFLLVVEEEGSDNFPNVNNAPGALEALRRADEAIGVARAYVAANPQTLLLTAADSDAGGMKMIGFREGQVPSVVPATASNGAPLDGQAGTATPPFLAAPDRHGRTFAFAIAWATTGDVSGSVLVRAEGLNHHLVRGSIDNTQIAQLIRLTLFGVANP